MTEPRTVVLTSAASGVGSAVIEVAGLSAETYRIIAVNSMPARLRNGDTVLPCPPTGQEDAFLSRVTALLDEWGEALVVPGRDEDAAVLCRASALITTHGGHVTSGPDWAVTAAFDKAVTAETFGPFGLSVAATAHHLKGGLEIGTERGWPLIVKPRFGNASRQVRIVKNEDSLFRTFRTGVDVIQEHLVTCPEDRRNWDGSLSGGRYGEYSLQIIFDRQGRVIAHFSSRNALVDGVPRLVETVSNAQLCGLPETAGGALGAVPVWGVWNLQGLRCSADEIKLFEINARPTGITGLRAHLGFNELDLLYETLVLEESPLPPPFVPTGLVMDTATKVPLR